ncbi:Tex-like N-terminal domain-containing protein [Mycoplasma elephantis]|uniref:Tex-like N-terminal domain-containing protein n=1 Tax=Mycoplasma elephantis TaxID=114882 RepID=UPI000483FFC2|nr:Tex-like N-terminal domain-containing protein [Mycoplasma elephantis]
MNKKIIKQLAEKLNIKEGQVEAKLTLLEQDSTVPFIARYRKDVTGNLDEEQIEFINIKYRYGVELEKRKEAIIDILKEKGLLTDEIKEAISKAETKAEVENIYEPYKVGKKTKATEAIALGLEPLAKSIFEATDKSFNPYAEAKKYINDKVPNVDFAIEQAQFIISQWISQDIETRKYVKNNIETYGIVVSKASEKQKEKDENKVYEIYYDFRTPIKHIKDYQILAINRASENKIVSYTLEFRDKPIEYELNNKYFKIPTTGKIINASLKDALIRLIYPSIEREIKSDLFARAEKNSIELFSENLESLLSAPVLKNKRILAIDPGYVSGCKIAIIDEKGKFLEKKLFYITKKNHFPEYKKMFLDLIKKHRINMIVSGNGTASHEVKEFVDEFLKENHDLKVTADIVSEVGASVYSASKIAIAEFPDLSVEERSAINIGRRHQDPLNELVKIDPKSLGIGQYQHDVNQKELKEALDFKVSKVVNKVGLEINSASKSILSYISGITPSIAEKLVEHVKETNGFKNRTEIAKVKGLTKKAYEQAIGFLRISDSPYYFDRTFVHPESYPLANKLIKHINLDLDKIDKKFVEELDREKLIKELGSNKSEIDMIVDALIEPYRDVRDERKTPNYNQNIKEISDVVENEIYEGIIKNITDFGAFVYFGIKTNALVHVSKLSEKITQSNKYKPEALVKIKILNKDESKGRIGAEIIEFI